MSSSQGDSCRWLLLSLLLLSLTLPFAATTTPTSTTSDAISHRTLPVTSKEATAKQVTKVVLDIGGTASDNVSVANDGEDPTTEQQQRVFLKKVERMSDALLRREKDAVLDNDGRIVVATTTGTATGTATDAAAATDQEDDSQVTEQSDLTRPGRYIHIVTTASLPWMTGTAVNPLLRAVHLHDRLKQINKNTNDDNDDNNDNTTSWVTLIVPWLELSEDQSRLYDQVFQNPQQQEDYVRNWLHENGMEDAASNMNIVWYPARYHAGLGSVFAMGDIISLTDGNQRDVCILEEPEHCNWFRAPGDGWTKKYTYVVGIVHTNYKEYAAGEFGGLWTAPALELISSAMVRAYTHKILKLSDVLQTYAVEKEVTSNVHGVRADFYQATTKRNSTTTTRKAYFIGKLVWAKGFDILLEHQEYFKEITGDYFPIDIYGSGPDTDEIQRSYLGRKHRTKNNTTPTTETATAPKPKTNPRLKRTMVRVFAWLNRGRRSRKRGNKKKSSETTSEGEEASSIDAFYEKVSDSLERLSLQAREALERFPTSTTELMESLESIQENAKWAMERIPLKAMETLDELVQELPKSLDLLYSSANSTETNSTSRSLQELAKQTLDQTKQKIIDLSNEVPKSMYELRRQPIPVTFPGRVDHAKLRDMEEYTIFVNPSTSEVLCTTTFEALAMGKFAIIPVHPSNKFFYKFTNCLAYNNKMEFVANLWWAMTHDPEPLSDDVKREFTWEAATDRLIEAAAITRKEALEREQLGKSKLDDRIAWFHNELGKGAKGDMIRKVFGAGPVSNQVKYQRSIHKERDQRDGTATGFEEESSISDDWLSHEYRDSSFVRAIHEATTNTQHGR